MDNEIRVQRLALHTLIPLGDFKEILGLDDREDKISRFCLLTATFTIEQYCKRRLLLKRHFDRIEFGGDLLLPLREYPVWEVLAFYAYCSAAEPELIEPEFYSLCPEIQERQDILYKLRLSSALRWLPGLTAFKVVYRAGYSTGKAPADLASACLELAAGLEEFTPYGDSYLAPRHAAFLVKYAHTNRTYYGFISGIIPERLA
jgi:hypothetical protein